MKGRSARREFWRTEAGFGLIEVMVSALVIVLVATATVTSIGASQKQSGRTLARGITANLAEQDQERMKAMRASDLIDYAVTRSILQESKSYTVDSESHLVQGPGGGRITCTSTGQQSQFLQLTTVVTPPVATDGDPQTIVSLRSLPITQYSPTSGTLIVQLVRADGVTGQGGIPVTLTGPDARSATTNPQGCAIFQYITPGSYSATVNSPGYVDETLSQLRSMSVTVSPGQISQTPIQRYDRIAALSPIRFNGANTGTASGITISNGGIPNPSTRAFAATTPTTSASGLFPFAANAYKAWAGRCDLNNPETWEPTFYTANAALYGPVTLQAAQTLPANVREPGMRVNVTLRARNQAFDTASARLFVRQIDSGCNNAQQFYGDPTGFTVAGVPSGTLGNGSTTVDSALTTYSRAFPYGRYWVCAQVTKSGGSGTNGPFSAVVSPVSNTTFAGQTTSGAPASAIIDASNAANGVGCITGTGNRWGTAGPTALPAPTPTP